MPRPAGADKTPANPDPIAPHLTSRQQQYSQRDDAKSNTNECADLIPEDDVAELSPLYPERPGEDVFLVVAVLGALGRQRTANHRSVLLSLVNLLAIFSLTRLDPLGSGPVDEGPDAQQDALLEAEVGQGGHWDLGLLALLDLASGLGSSARLHSPLERPSP